MFGRTIKITIAIFLLAFGTVWAIKKFDIEGYGDHSLWVLVNEVKDEFSKDTGLSLNLLPEAAIKGAGCMKGILHAASGDPGHDFGFICCGLPDKTIKEYNLSVYPVAKEPLAIILHKDNPVSSLTVEQIKNIFSGRISNWKGVGGPNMPIVVITRMHCKDQFYGNWQMILSSPNKFRKDRLDVSSESDMARTVADYRQSIGHLEMTSIYENKIKHTVKIIAVNGHIPDTKNLKEGLYPFPTNLALVTKGEAGDKVMMFIEYLRTSPKVAKIMLKYGMFQHR